MNLTETYFELAKSAPGFSLFEDEGMYGCQSQISHPSGNVIFIARPSPSALVRFQDRKRNLNPFTSLYVLPTSASDFVNEQLVRAGFSKANRLNLMFFRGQSTGEQTPIHRVAPETRAVRSQEMADMFFNHLGSSFCSEVAGLTFRSRCQLWEAELFGGLAMTHEVYDTFGIYNLVVTPMARSVGNGTRMVQSLIHVGIQSKKRVVLQCHDHLVEWYETLGFRKYGEVSVLH